jgi:hypothetical protein
VLEEAKRIVAYIQVMQQSQATSSFA